MVGWEVDKSVGIPKAQNPALSLIFRSLCVPVASVMDVHEAGVLGCLLQTPQQPVALSYASTSTVSFDKIGQRRRTVILTGFLFFS